MKIVFPSYALKRRKLYHNSQILNITFYKFASFFLETFTGAESNQCIHVLDQRHSMTDEEIHAVLRLLIVSELSHS